MNNQKYEIYKRIMTDEPALNFGFLKEILDLAKNEIIDRVDITEVKESNTAIVIKASVKIKTLDNSRVKKLFIKTIKINKTENAYHNISMNEGKFYKFVKENSFVNLPIPLCYDVFLSEEKGEFVIILEDISHEYTPVNNEILMNKNFWFSCAESLAGFHSAFWNHQTVLQQKYEDEHDDQADRECLRSFFHDFKMQIDDRTKTILSRAMEINMSLIKESARRIKSGDGVTICNGDSHIGNFMLPKGSIALPMIIDFQFWGAGIGTQDLAHLTRDGFPDELKRKIQIPLVEHYYKSLLSHGVANYSWEQCFNDYLTSVASMTLIPLWQYSCFNLKYEDWINDLRVYIDNYEYLQCREIV